MLNPRIFPAHLHALTQAIQSTFIDGKPADKAISSVLAFDKNKGSKDRAIIAEMAYEQIRWLRQLSFIANVEHNDFSNNATALRMAAWLYTKFKQIPQLNECQHFNVEIAEKRIQQKNRWPKPILFDIPDELYSLINNELHSKTHDYLHALNKPNQLHLRINSIKSQNPTEIANELNTNPLTLHNNHAIILPNGFPIFKHELYLKGFVEVQDLGSQQISPFLQAEPGMRIIDACAGAGGKSLHLAAIMNNKGRILCMDIHPFKLDELKRRAKRAGISICETRPIINSKSIKKLHHSADRILLDVPCSGLGVLRRNPDAKWKINSDFIHRIKLTQQDIIHNYASMLKPGGKMVYATCSILPSENEKQVNLFLKNNPQFKLEDQQSIFPENSDGYFMARISKN